MTILYSQGKGVSKNLVCVYILSLFITLNVLGSFSSHHNVSEGDFLGLALLDKLHHLEVLDWYCSLQRPAECYAPSSPRLPHLIGRLRHLTNNRVHVTSKRHQDPLLCQCLS